jgi:hypothetical protein
MSARWSRKRPVGDADEQTLVPESTCPHVRLKSSRVTPTRPMPPTRFDGPSGSSGFPLPVQPCSAKHFSYEAYAPSRNSDDHTW